MVKDKLRTNIKFDVDVEYSLNNGVSWSTLLAGVTEYIEQDSITAGFVKIRTVNIVTNLTDISNEFFKGRVLDFVNIRQGKNITSLASIFYSVQGDEIRVANLPLCTNLNSTFQFSDLGTLTVKNFPEVTTAVDSFRDSNIGIISSVNFPKLTSGDAMYAYVNSDVIGDIKLSNASIASSSIIGLMMGSDTNGTPSVSIESLKSNSLNAFNSNLSLYALYSNIGVIDSNSTGFMNSSSFKINGFDYKFEKANDINSLSGTTMLTPGSRINKPIGAYLSIANANNIDSSISQETKDRLSQTTYPAIINFDWLPQYKLLRDNTIGYTNLTSANAKQMGRLGSEFVFVDSNDDLQILNKHRSFKRTSEFTRDSLNRKFLSKSVYFGKNSYYATYNGSDIVLYNETSTPVITVSEPNVTFIDISSDASRLTYITTTSGINLTASTDDTVTQSIKVINGTNGQVIQSNNYTHVNEHITSVYNPSNDSVIAMAINRFIPNIPLVIKDRGIARVEFYATLNTSIIGSEEVSHFIDFSFGTSGDEVELEVVEKSTGKTSLLFVGSKD
jgi:hypothetical protein